MYAALSVSLALPTTPFEGINISSISSSRAEDRDDSGHCLGNTSANSLLLCSAMNSSHIDNLPNETLLEIFEIGQRTSSFTLPIPLSFEIIVSHVSRRWRQLILAL